MEGGSVYVRERGKLRRVGDTALAPAAPPADGRTESRAPTNKNGRITSRAEGSLRFSESLFQMTLSFVVDNIQHVDSLVGFPEQIGRTVFSAAAEGHVFSGPDASKALRLFADAYGETLLGSLCLRNRWGRFPPLPCVAPTVTSSRLLPLVPQVPAPPRADGGDQNVLQSEVSGPVRVQAGGPARALPARDVTGQVRLVFFYRRMNPR